MKWCLSLLLEYYSFVTSTPQNKSDEDEEVQTESEKSKEVQVNSLTLAERRSVMIELDVNSVMSSLIHRTIISFWKVSGPSPLMKHPPYTWEETEDLKNQAGERCFSPNVKNAVHLTGVINDKE